MGKFGSGKISMRSIIFANYFASLNNSNQLFLCYSISSREELACSYLDNLVLNLWDCGGQEVIYKRNFESHRDHTFRSVELLIYVLILKVVKLTRATFLVISHVTHTYHRDIHRFEKISNIQKQFKVIYSETQVQF
ncbi:putative gtr1/RagA G protein [Plasmopara halstedii]